MTSARTDEILTAYIATFSSGKFRDADVAAAFTQLLARVPNLTAEELVSAADRAKAIATELRGLAWRLGRAAEHQRRRAEGR